MSWLCLCHINKNHINISSPIVMQLYLVPNWILGFNWIRVILCSFKWFLPSCFLQCMLFLWYVHLCSIRAAEAFIHCSAMTAALIGCWHFVMKPRWIFSALILQWHQHMGWAAPGPLSSMTTHMAIPAGCSLLSYIHTLIPYICRTTNEPQLTFQLDGNPKHHLFLFDVTAKCFSFAWLCFIIRFCM